MKKSYNKIKTYLASLWVVILTLFTKTMGQNNAIPSMYWVEYCVGSSCGLSDKPSKTRIAKTIRTGITNIWQQVLNIWQRVIIALTFIIWIISFFRIRKTKNKTLKKKRTKIAIIIISILLIILIESIIYKLVD